MGYSALGREQQAGLPLPLEDLSMERNYYQLACELAQDAVENHILTRRGIWYLEKEDLLCIYDNNPYADDPEARNRQEDRIIRRLRMGGIELIARGEDRDGYTTTLLIDCSWDRAEDVQDIVREEVEATMRELDC